MIEEEDDHDRILGAAVATFTLNNPHVVAEVEMEIAAAVSGERKNWTVVAGRVETWGETNFGP
jgi:hypothetical protein